VIWDNKDLWAKADVVTGWQLVDKVLKRGEKEKCIELIESLSGYTDEDAKPQRKP
jgi:Phage XkdN-like protein.